MCHFCRVLFLVVLALGFLAGCSKHRHNRPLPIVQPVNVACTQNAYLRQYHCDIDLIERKAEQADADAEYALGYMYFYGINTEKDEYAGAAWMRAAAGQGQQQAIMATNLLDLYWYPRMGRIAAFHR